MYPLYISKLSVALTAVAGCVLALHHSPTLALKSVAPAPTLRPIRVLESSRTAPAEVRALWVVRDTITTLAGVQHVVANAKAHHFNTLFVQVRGRGDSYYLSSLEPRAESLANAPANFDPLQATIVTAHAAGLQVHAWVNTCLVWSNKQPPHAPDHVVNAHPDWLDRDSHGGYLMQEGPNCEGAFLSPANLAARKHIHDVFLDIARRYDIDGLHFDYIRYPNPSYDYSAASTSRFAAEMDAVLSPADRVRVHAAQAHDKFVYEHMFPEHFQDFRRRQVTELVRDVSHDVKQIKPWVIMSAAVFADYGDAYKVRGQDWKLWLREGYLDAVAPMAYGKSTQLVAAQIADAVQAAHASGRMVFAGIGSWHIPAESTIEKISAARSLGANGEVLFSYGGITNDGASNDYLDKVASSCYRTKASVPAMPWIGARPKATANANGGAARSNGGG